MYADVHQPLGPRIQHAEYRRTREMSLEDLLLENRIIFLTGPIMERTSTNMIMRLLYLQSIKKDEGVSLYINSQGGLIDQTLAIYDTLQFMTCEAATYCIGQAVSGAAVILMAGAKGKRFILPNAKVMLHQPYGGITGHAEDVRIQAEEVLRDKQRLNEIIAKHTGKSVQMIQEDTERDCYLSAEEAVEYGIVDEVLREDSKPDVKPAIRKRKKRKK